MRWGRSRPDTTLGGIRLAPGDLLLDDTYRWAQARYLGTLVTTVTNLTNIMLLDILGYTTCVPYCVCRKLSAQ